MTAVRHPPVDPLPNVAGLRTLGTGAQQAAAGNDPRLGRSDVLGGGNAHSAYDGITPIDGGVAANSYSVTPIDGGGA